MTDRKLSELKEVPYDKSIPYITDDPVEKYRLRGPIPPNWIRRKIFQWLLGWKWEKYLG